MPLSKGSARQHGAPCQSVPWESSTIPCDPNGGKMWRFGGTHEPKNPRISSPLSRVIDTQPLTRLCDIPVRLFCLSSHTAYSIALAIKVCFHSTSQPWQSVDPTRISGNIRCVSGRFRRARLARTGCWRCHFALRVVIGRHLPATECSPFLRAARRARVGTCFIAWPIT